MLVKNIPTYWSSTSSEIIIYRNNSGFAVANFLDIFIKKNAGYGGGWGGCPLLIYFLFVNRDKQITKPFIPCYGSIHQHKMF